LLGFFFFTSSLAAAPPDFSREALSLVLVVNINTASESDLTSLDGIDAKLARAIVAYRQITGPFKTIEDIRNVEGMTQATFDKIRNQITVSGPSRPADDYRDYRVSPRPAAPTQHVDVPEVTAPAPAPKAWRPSNPSVQEADRAPPTVVTPSKGSSPDFSPAEEAAAIDKYYGELKQANIVFSAPQSMEQSATSTVNLWLDPTDTLASLEEALRAVVKKNEHVDSAPAIKWAPRTRATLSSPGFDITPQPEIELAVSPTMRTEWTWQVHPKDSGTQTLHLALEAIVPCEGKDCFRVIKTFDRDIEVRVSPIDFVEQNWRWLIATLILPFGVWLWNRKHPLRRKPKTIRASSIETKRHDGTDPTQRSTGASPR
jgi:competence ComEA-like helix-hairpin-helix protein